jgi:DNA-binding transcriptional MocR family regulator
MLVDGHYRKHLSRLRERLGEARVNVVRAFERIGLEMFAEPTDGMFIWARLPNIADSFTLAESAQSEGVVLAPGAVFRPHLERSPWMRFNVATCDNPRIERWLERQLAKAPNRRMGSRAVVASGAEERLRRADCCLPKGCRGMAGLDVKRT